MKLTRGKKPEKGKPEPVRMQIEPSRAGSLSDASAKKTKAKGSGETDSIPAEKPRPRKEKPAGKKKPGIEWPEPRSHEPDTQFTVSPGRLENQVAELRVKLGNLSDAVEGFMERINAMQRDLSEMKMKAASSVGARPAKDGKELKERMDEMETVLEKMSERLKESSGAAKPAGADTAISERVSGIEDGIKGMKDRLDSIDSRIGELEQKPQPQEAQAPEAGDVGGRLDTFDSRISGVTDKLMKLSEDMQKLTSYFMEGIKHVESRIMEIESDKATQPEPEENKLTPSSFRSRIKREFSSQNPEEHAPRIRLNPRLPIPIRRQPPEQDSSGKAETGSQPSASGIPPAPAPDRGNMFTKLREGTVVRKPLPSRDPEKHEIEVLMEHIRERAQRRESREKIRRDLLNAGYDPNLIARAFMTLRAG